MNKKKEWIILFLYITGFLVIASTIAFLQPLADTQVVTDAQLAAGTPDAADCRIILSNPPDEHARFLIPRYICEHGTIPTGFEEEVRIPSYGFSYGLYNVFPYIVQGYLMRFVSLFTDSKLLLLYAARFVNVLSGTCMAYLVYLLSKRLFGDKGFRWVFCFAVMYLPQSLFLHTYVNTDSMCMLAVTMMLYALVRAYEEGFTGGNNQLLSGGIILCALSYYNAYGYILSSILLFLVYFLRKQGGKWSYDWRKMLRKGIFISVIVLAGISWWFIRSYILYDGDMLGLATREKMAAEYAIEAVNPQAMSTYESKGYTILQMMKEEDFMEGAFYSFVAAFGSMAIFADIWIYRFYKIFFAAGTFGCFLYCALCLIKGRSISQAVIHRGNAHSSFPAGETTSFRLSGRTNSAHCASWQNVFFHINMLFCIAMPLILLIHYAYTMDFQNQGRYLLPSVIPIMYYMTRGFETLTTLKIIPTWLKRITIALLILLPLASTLWMTYYAALPLYFQTGVVLE